MPTFLSNPYSYPNFFCLAFSGFKNDETTFHLSQLNCLPLASFKKCQYATLSAVIKSWAVSEIWWNSSVHTYLSPVYTREIPLTWGQATGKCEVNQWSTRIVCLLVCALYQQPQVKPGLKCCSIIAILQHTHAMHVVYHACICMSWLDICEKWN